MEQKQRLLDLKGHLIFWDNEIAECLRGMRAMQDDLQARIAGKRETEKEIEDLIKYLQECEAFNY